MAKQRPQPRPKGQTSAPSRQSAAAKKGGSPHPPDSSTESQPSRPARRSTYGEAVALYEQGVQALQQHQYAEAQRLLGSVLTRYPDEKELHERVRLYLNICQRQATPRAPSPQTVDERLYAATLALNEGHYDEAISHLRLVRDEDPDNDYALYMLAVAHAQRGEHVEALAHLERSITLNPDNRSLARQDPDLDILREDGTFQDTLDAAARTNRRGPRPKSLR
ncbi:MAG: tetratricopeptide repeat protein [Vicinamibacterales bacterium]